MNSKCLLIVKYYSMVPIMHFDNISDEYTVLINKATGFRGVTNKFAFNNIVFI